MDALTPTSRSYSALDLLLYLVGAAGLAACLTLMWLGMRAVMTIGGFCAEGGPYEIATPCPQGVPETMLLGIFGLFAFGGMMAWKGNVIGGVYAKLVGLTWPALFISLGFNFLEFSFSNQGIVLGALIPGVIFIIMGIAPLPFALPIPHAGRARSNLGERVAGARPADWWLGQVRRPTSSGGGAGDSVSKLERLAALHTAGALTDDEFARAKQRLLDEGDVQ